MVEAAAAVNDAENVAANAAVDGYQPDDQIGGWTGAQTGLTVDLTGDYLCGQEIHCVVVWDI